MLESCILRGLSATGPKSRLTTGLPNKRFIKLTESWWGGQVLTKKAHMRGAERILRNGDRTKYKG